MFVKFWLTVPLKLRKRLTVDESLDPVVLGLGLEGDEVHAPLAAVVPGVEPVPLGVADEQSMFIICMQWTMKRYVKWFFIWFCLFNFLFMPLINFYACQRTALPRLFVFVFKSCNFKADPDFTWHWGRCPARRTSRGARCTSGRHLCSLLNKQAGWLRIFYLKYICTKHNRICVVWYTYSII